MPPGYRTAAAWGAPGEAWSRGEQLLAGVFDAVQHLDWVFRAAWRDKDSHAPQKPEPLARPGLEETPQKRRDAFNARFRSLGQA